MPGNVGYVARQISKNRLCRDRDETIYHLISHCRKLAQNEN